MNRIGSIRRKRKSQFPATLPCVLRNIQGRIVCSNCSKLMGGAPEVWSASCSWQILVMELNKYVRRSTLRFEHYFVFLALNYRVSEPAYPLQFHRAVHVDENT